MESYNLRVNKLNYITTQSITKYIKITAIFGRCLTHFCEFNNIGDNYIYLI